MTLIIVIIYLTKVNMGLRTGDVLSPILFNLILEQLIRDTNSNNKIAFGYWNIYILAYTDDIAMLGDTEEMVKQVWSKLMTMVG